VNGVVLYDDAAARALQPFALTRPAGELRAGATLQRERWAHVARRHVTGFVSSHHLRDFEELDAPSAATGSIPAGTLLVNARFAPALSQRLDDATLRWNCGGEIAAVRLTAPLDAAALADGSATLASLVEVNAPAASLEGWWIHDVWDLIRHLQEMLASDIPELARDFDAPPAHLTVLGEHAVYVERGAYIEPMVLADTTAGPIVISAGARIAAFTRLVGPCAIGRDCQIAGGRVSGCSIGEQARVHGEISSSIVIGHANKSHDGFVGHSVLGRWSNLGAGTITSNLKNSYGGVSLWTTRGIVPSGMQFLGTMFGDHAKTAIGTRLTTGTVVGPGANVFGTEMPAKFVPPFAWGDVAPYETFEAEKFLSVVAKVMARRAVPLSAAQRDTLRRAWELRSTLRP
jgi:UDP-N-acetylglucosamine diphosphorylase/glucosamine-1-phosphate N-acetyltransferase